MKVLVGRIAVVADVFDALTMDRPYRKAFTVPDARDMLRHGRGTHFDPTVVDLFLDSSDEIMRIKDGAVSV